MKIQLNMDNAIQCLICGKEFLHLGSHIWHRHKILAKDYKAQFGLDYKFPLISPSVKRKKQIAFEEDREKYLKNLLVGGIKHQFKKGHKPNRQYISEQSKDRLRVQSANIKVQLKGLCPVCNIGFDNVDSHLHMKHGLKHV